MSTTYHSLCPSPDGTTAHFTVPPCNHTTACLTTRTVTLAAIGGPSTCPAATWTDRMSLLISWEQRGLNAGRVSQLFVR